MDKTLRRKLIKYFKIVGFSLLACITIFTGVLIGRKVLSSVYRTEKKYETRLIPGVSPTPDSRNFLEKIVDSVVEPEVKLNPTALDTNKAPAVGANEIKSQSTSTNIECIVTLWGSKYDVTSLRSTHTGGDVFNCGTDMSGLYEPQHGSNLSRMQKYLILSSSSSGGTTTAQATNPPSSQSNACIVTIGGEYFDVTALRTSHSGGDVFSCGSDMTSMYRSQHGTDMTRMLSYKLASANSTPLPTVTPRPGNTATAAPTAVPTAPGTLVIDETDDGTQAPNF